MRESKEDTPEYEGQMIFQGDFPVENEPTLEGQSVSKGPRGILGMLKEWIQ